MENKIKKLYICMGIMLIMVLGCITVSAATLINSKDVVYDNTVSGLRSTTVQGAVDELYSAATDYSDHERRLQELESNLFLSSHPVGSIYVTVSEEENTTEKMHNLYGGTWESYGQGRTLVGVGTGTDSNGTVKVFNKNESLGEYNHTLSVSEMPSHTHIQNPHNHVGLRWAYEGGTGFSMGTGNPIEVGTKGYYGIRLMDNMNMSYDTEITTTNSTATNQNTGESSSHNNIQPYITVYMYKRVN